MGCLTCKGVNLPSMICTAFSKNVYYTFQLSQATWAPSTPNVPKTFSIRLPA